MDEGTVLSILEGTGEDLNREGLKKTPQRFINAWGCITSGYGKKLEDVVNGAFYEAEDGDMVIVKDIDFFSTCEHHLLPFFGKIHVAYIPKKKIIGLSKIPRIVDMYARRLQVQERMCSQVADAIEKALAPKGVAVVAEATHCCMVLRGVQKVNSKTVTSVLRGCFRTDGQTRGEFLSLIK